MNVSRASGLAGGLSVFRRSGVGGWPSAAFPAVALMALMTTLSPLSAQEPPAAPITLFPPTVLTPAPAGEAPADTGGAAELPSQPPADPQSTTTLGEAPEYSGIQVDRLQALDVESLGILEVENGGLGLDAWAGSDRRLVERLIAALPSEPGSPVLQALATRLLLTNARAPQLGGAANPDVTAVAPQGTDFLRLRAERLYAMGDLAGLNRLLGIVPQRVDDPWLAQARVDGLLLAGEDEEACRQVAGAVARFPGETYWTRAQVLCQFMAGQRDQAFLALDLLREQDPDGDPAFYALTGLFIGGQAADIDAASLTPLTMAMLRVGDGALPADFAEGAAPLLLHGVAPLAKASPADRALARERLVQAAILPGDALAEAFDGFSFEPSELSDPLVAAKDIGGVRGRALLFHAASRERIATAKAEFLLAAMTEADAAGRGYAMALAVRPQLATLMPGLELAWFAPTAARSFYRVGRFERATAWAEVLRLDGLKNPPSLAAYEDLKPIARLAGSTLSLTAGAAAQPGEGEGADVDRDLLVMVLSRALDQEETGIWPGLLDASAGQEPDADLPPLARLPALLALGDAAAAGRRGETVVLATLALGKAETGELHPLALGYVVSALSAVGLGGDARALALEAAAGNAR